MQLQPIAKYGMQMRPCGLFCQEDPILNMGIIRFMFLFVICYFLFFVFIYVCLFYLFVIFNLFYCYRYFFDQERYTVTVPKGTAFTDPQVEAVNYNCFYGW